MQEALKITRDEEDFRAPQELINGYFIEANIDSNTKFKTLKKLLSSFELEDELLIKYAADSEQDGIVNRHVLRREFWSQLLPQLHDTTLFSKVKSTKDHWLQTGAGVSGVSYTFLITRTYARIELTISTSNKEINKRYFNQLEKRKDQIEQRFGQELVWEELEDNKMSRVKCELGGVNLFEESNWEEMSGFFIENLPKFELAFKQEIDKLKGAVLI